MGRLFQMLFAVILAMVAMTTTALSFIGRIVGISMSPLGWARGPTTLETLLRRLWTLGETLTSTVTSVLGGLPVALLARGPTQLRGTSGFVDEFTTRGPPGGHRTARRRCTDATRMSNDSDG